MRVFLNVVLFVLFSCFSAHAAESVASASYINFWIQKYRNVDLGNDPGNSIASLSYLYSSINKANELLYGQATTYAVDDAHRSNLVTVSIADLEMNTKIKLCAPGTYMPAQSADYECVDCGLGHYCSGGRHRAVCTGGAIACNGINHTADATTDANRLNRVLKKDEVVAWIPQTNIGRWGKVSCCGVLKNGKLVVDMTGIPCATGTIGPGTYLFVERYGERKNQKEKDPIDGKQNYVSSAHMAVFDHPVGYQSKHGAAIFFTFVDTNNATYKNERLRFPNSNSWYANKNDQNIPDIQLEIKPQDICVYELKY
jgi:hypothetical protein